MKTKWMIVASGVVSLTWALWGSQSWLLPYFGFEWNVPELGQWGDTFGALNALFSAFAFVAILFTLKQQQEELSNQQKQIETAEEEQHLQRFERTFYELLRLLREAREDVEFRHSNEYRDDLNITHAGASDRVVGVEAFKRAHVELMHWTKHSENDGPISSKVMADLYKNHVHQNFESTFAPYYRLLYTLLLRIKHEDNDEKRKPNPRKYHYGNLLRSQLTSHEVAMCSYNGLADGSEKFKDLIIEYRLLKYLPVELGRKQLELYYPASAFLGRDAVVKADESTAVTS
ncbi:UNVERIFIED_ORG: hypothetical protein GGD43_000017 [Rhizobium esperanzae]